MKSPYLKQMKEWAVYWETDSNNEFGEETFKAPVEIRCQWNDFVQEIIDWKGIHTVSNSQIMVPSALVPGSFMLYGRLADVLTPSTPREIVGIARILRCNRIPRVRGDSHLRVVYL